MAREILALALVLAFVIPAPAEPERAESARVSGGSSKSVGEKSADVEECPGECEDPDEDPCVEDIEFPVEPMLWEFVATKKSCLEAIRTLFKKFPGEVKFGEIKREEGEYVMEVRTLAKSFEEEEAFNLAMEEKVPAVSEDISWGCAPDEKRIEEMEKEKEKQEAQKEKDAAKKAKAPEPKK